MERHFTAEKQARTQALKAAWHLPREIGVELGYSYV